MKIWAIICFTHFILGFLVKLCCNITFIYMQGLYIYLHLYLSPYLLLSIYNPHNINSPKQNFLQSDKQPTISAIQLFMFHNYKLLVC